MSYASLFDLTGQLAVVTGGASGIGLESARALAAHGARLELIDMDSKALDRAAEILRGEGAEVDTCVLDVTDPDAVRAVSDQICQRSGVPHVLMASAGIARLHSATGVSDAEWRKVIDVNLNGVFWCCRAFGARMVTEGRGSIVNMGSMSGTIINTPQFASSYMASKGAVHQITRALAVEWAKTGVRVNTLAPGYIGTGMTLEMQAQPELFNKWIEMTPMGRCGEPAEIAAAVVFLASRASSYMTGSILAVDGGYTCL